MALATGSGPFGGTPGGRFNFAYEAPDHVLYVEPSPRKLRLVVDDRTLAETTAALLLHETGLLPVYYLPREDVELGALSASDTRTTCPFKGEARYWSLETDRGLREDLAWSYEETVEGCPPIDGYLAFRWDGVDEWWEEAERISVHARDPYHRVDVLESDRHVVIEAGGTVVAESRRPTMLFETGLPPRFYLSPADVVREHLVEVEHTTACPYKGVTSRYFDLVTGGERIERAAWMYDFPRPEAIGIQGRLAFYQEKVDVIVDGERWERPDLRPNWS